MDILARSILLLSAIAPAIATPNPKITAPAILPRQIQTTIVGYYSLNGGWGSAWCNPGWRYCTSANYAACGTITDTTCNVPVSCTSTSMAVDRLGSSLRCTFSTNTLCGTNTIYQSPGDTPPVTSIVCRQSGATDLTLYRSFPDAGVSIATSSVTSSTKPLSSMTSMSTLSSTTGFTSSSTSTPTTTPVPPPKSKAWIAGPVIGGLAVIAGVVAGMIILRRKRSAPSAAQQGEYPQRGYHEEKMPQMVDTSEQPYYPQPPTAYRPAEMEAPTVNPVGIAELGPKH